MALGHSARASVLLVGLLILIGGLPHPGIAQGIEEAVPQQWRDYRALGNRLSSQRARDAIAAALVLAYDQGGAENAARRLASAIETPAYRALAHTEIARSQINRGELNLADETLRETIADIKQTNADITASSAPRRSGEEEAAWHTVWDNIYFVYRVTGNWQGLIDATKVIAPDTPAVRLGRWRQLSETRPERFGALIGSTIERELDALFVPSDINNEAAIRALDVPSLIPHLTSLNRRDVAERLLQQLLGVTINSGGDIALIDVQTLALDHGFPEIAIQVVRRIQSPAAQIASWSTLAHRLTSDYGRTDGGVFMGFAVNAASQLGGRVTASQRLFALTSLAENQTRLGQLADAFRTANLFTDARDRDAVLLRVMALLLEQNQLATAATLVPYIDQIAAQSEAFVLLADAPIQPGESLSQSQRRVDQNLRAALNTGAFSAIDPGGVVDGKTAAQRRIERLSELLVIQILRGSAQLREQFFVRLNAIAEATQLPNIGDRQGPTLSPFDQFFAEVTLTLIRASVDSAYDDPALNQQVAQWRNQLWSWHNDDPEAVSALQLLIVQYALRTEQLDSAADLVAEIAGQNETLVADYLQQVIIAATLEQRDALALRMIQQITVLERRQNALDVAIRLRAKTLPKYTSTP